jgi:iron complex outermembrane recepter protein
MRKVPLCLTSGVFIALTVLSRVPSARGDDALDMDLSDLVKTKVTSLTRSEQNVFSAPAAVYVVSNADIKRSPARTVPDILRQVPGLVVAQTHSGQYAITARGPNHVYSNKLLILIDGHSLYDSSFAGTFWEAVFPVLEDVERIEVIRGPGASAWGANAVNGVINIISKSSKDTQGTFIQAGGGNFERSFGLVRQGGTLGTDTTYRMSGTWDHRGITRPAQSGLDSSSSEDEIYRGGIKFRADVRSSPESSYMQQVYFGGTWPSYTYRLPDASTPDLTSTKNQRSSADIFQAQGRWDVKHDESSSSRVQWLIEKYGVRKSPLLGQDRSTFEVDAQHTYAPLKSDLSVVGLHARAYWDRISADANKWHPERANVWLVDGFIQKQNSFFDDTLTFLFGSKIEYNDFTGFEFQPTLRTALQPFDHHVFWAGISRAVRTPGRTQDGVQVQTYIETDPETQVQLQPVIRGSHDLSAEQALSVEFGHRFEPSSSLNFDSTIFFSNLRDQMNGVVDLNGIYFEDGATLPRLPVNYTNVGSLNTRGFELATVWKPSRQVDFVLTYTRLMTSSSVPSENTFILFEESLRSSIPKNQGTFNTVLHLPYDLQSTTLLRAMDSIAEYKIPGYLTLDHRLDWKASKTTTVSLIGRNLIGAPLVEFQAPLLFSGQRQIGRSIFGELTFRF